MSFNKFIKTFAKRELLNSNIAKYRKYFRDEHKSVVLSRKNTRLATVSPSNNPGEQLRRHSTRYIDYETASLALDGWCDETKGYPNDVSWLVQSQFRRDEGSFQRVGQHRQSQETTGFLSPDCGHRGFEDESSRCETGPWSEEIVQGERQRRDGQPRRIRTEDDALEFVVLFVPEDNRCHYLRTLKERFHPRYRSELPRIEASSNESSDLGGRHGESTGGIERWCRWACFLRGEETDFCNVKLCAWC